jgi:uncharacterized protein YbaP (TraB family)
MIRRRLGLAVFAVCAVVAGIGQRALSQDTKTGSPLFLWKVTAEGGGEAWLFGSIHAGTKEMYPLADAIEKAFAGSKKLVVEADIEKIDPASVQALIFTKGMYPEGDSLSKHLKPETIQILRGVVAKSGLPFEALERMKPWLVGVMLSAMTIDSAGMDPALGLDMHFHKAARAGNKEVVELEGAEQQLDMIISMADAEQEANLVASLAESDKSVDQLTMLVNAWKNGDAAKLESISLASMEAHPETKPAYDTILYKRNERMVEKIEGYLKTKDSHFVVVGALHLVGNKGIVKLLESKKYKVEQIKK